MESTRNTSSGRMSRGHSAPEMEKTSGPSLRNSAKSRTPSYLFLDLRTDGNPPVKFWEIISPSLGESWTRNTSASPSAAAVSTLSEILQADVPEKYYLSMTGLSGYSAEGGQARQRAAGSSAGGSGASGLCLNDQGGAFIDISQNITGTLRAASNSHEPCVVSAVFENHGQSTRYKEISRAAPTVTATYGTGGNNQPFVVRRPMVGSARVKFKDNPIAPTLDTKGESPFCNQAGVSVLESFTQDAYSKYSENAIGAALRNSGGMPETLVYSTSHSSHHTRADANTAGTLAATDYKDPPTIAIEPCYTVRRLTPTECARLQGLPDWWCKNLDDPNPSDDEIHFWRGVWDEWNAMNNKKPKSESRIRKWLSNPYSDSAEYKLYGNGIALPCGRFVLAGIAWADKQK